MLEGLHFFFFGLAFPSPRAVVEALFSEVKALLVWSAESTPLAVVLGLVLVGGAATPETLLPRRKREENNPEELLVRVVSSCFTDDLVKVVHPPTQREQGDDETIRVQMLSVIIYYYSQLNAYARTVSKKKVSCNTKYNQNCKPIKLKTYSSMS